MALRGTRVFQYTIDGKNDSPYNKVTEQYFEARKMMYGAPRRNLLLSLFKQGLEFYVNRRGYIHTDKDPDIQYLLKRGKIEMVNEPQRTVKFTFVRLKR